MSQATFEERLTALEERVRELQEAMRSREPSPEWLERVIGSMKGEAEFGEVVAHGRAIRQADRLAEEPALR
jgi:hypothetical protein